MQVVCTVRHDGGRWERGSIEREELGDYGAWITSDSQDTGHWTLLVSNSVMVASLG